MDSRSDLTKDHRISGCRSSYVRDGWFHKSLSGFLAPTVCKGDYYVLDAGSIKFRPIKSKSWYRELDSLTHITLGATIGDAMVGSRIKRKALLLGAFSQSIPDFDFVTTFWSDDTSDLLGHRGFSHSFLFALLLSPALAWIARRWDKNGLPYRTWCLFFLVQILTHDLLDSLNAYGTGWFEPFSHLRVSFNALFVADPLVTIWLIIASLGLLWHRRDSYRKVWIRFGLLMSGATILLAGFNKLIIQHAAEKSMTTLSIKPDRYFTTPTPFNSFLWYVVAEEKNGFQIGYRSVFDPDTVMQFQYFPRQDSLLKRIREHKEVNDLIRFSQGYFVAQQSGDTLVFNDLRFGQAGGWVNPRADFVFHYYLEKPGQNRLVLQRSRFSGLEMKSFLRRIRGDR